MNRTTILATAMFLLAHFGVAGAVSTHSYQVVQESIYLAASLACFLWAFRIFLALRGGSLQNPWIFFSAAFAVAAIGGLVHLLDLFQIAIHQYDLRPATLATTCGTVILLLLGLIIYKRDLE